MELRILDEPLMTVGLGVAFAKDDTRGICQKLEQTLSLIHIFPLWENNIVELENGDLIMLMRAERSGFLYKSISHDGGYTWSEAEKTDIPNPNSKITLIRQENKILLFHNPNSNYQGVIFDMRKPLSLWIS